MSLIYSIGIFLYGIAIRMASLFNSKAQQWINGRKTIFSDISTAIEHVSQKGKTRKLAWFHCASVGEFEQGRPLMEAFRREHPGYILLLTFFSPSGYELRKNYSGADVVSYLPLDKPSNAGKFLDIVQPDIVFFVKYEFWFNYLKLLQQKDIPHYLVSAIFRADQHFFKWYGDWPRNILKGFTHIFVQNTYSQEILEFIGITNVTVSGDTRFDRVSEIAAKQENILLVEEFTAGEKVLVAGSTWPSDEELIIRLMQQNSEKYKLIIAPHEIREDEIAGLCERFGEQLVRFSKAEITSIAKYRILLIDSVGMLSMLYRYGKIAYIGGGFGSGIHNILEAAVYGMPVLFGPNYHKFHEAVELIDLKGAFVIHQYEDLQKYVNLFLGSAEKLEESSAISHSYVSGHKGATQRIMESVVVP